MNKLLIILTFWCSSIFASENRYFTHTMGFQGSFTIGMEKDFSDWTHQLSLGYSPSYVSGHDLTQVNFLSLYNLGRARMGLGVLYGHHDRLFVVLPKQYPRNYYPPSAIRYLLTFQLPWGAFGYNGFFTYQVLDTELINTYNAVNRRIGESIGSAGFSVYLD